jgi:hypothetical protein
LASGRERYPLAIDPDSAPETNLAESIRFLPSQKIRTLPISSPLSDNHTMRAAMYVAEQAAHAQGLVGRALHAHRRKAIRPIVAKFRRWLAAVEPTLLPSEPLAVAVGYYQRHGDALFRFLDDPDVPIDNSPTEREFQTVAKLRLNMLFAGSTEGAHRACVLLGIVATCRTVGVPVQAYLSWAFERLGTHRDTFALPLEAMTPAAFKKTLG